MMVLARRLATGLIAAALTALWAILIMTLDPHALAVFGAAPRLAVTLGATFVGIAFLVGIALGRSEH